MKKSLFLFSMTFLSVTAYAQDCRKTELDIRVDSTLKNAEPCIITAANIILDHPLHFESLEHSEYKSLLLEWMDKTTQFTFVLNPMMLDICTEKHNMELLGIYMSCLAKCAIELRKDYTGKALEMFIAYAHDKNNDVKKTSKLKKLLKAGEEKDLSVYL